MEHSARSRFNTQIYEEACEWFVECRGGELEAAALREFDRWLRKSPEHLSAYLEIAAIWNEGSSLDPLHEWDADTLIAEAAADRDNVLPFVGGISAPSSPRALESIPEAVSSAQSRAAPSGTGKSSRRRRRRALAAAASIAILSLVALTWSQVFRTPTYATGIGEQRSIVLADGSTIELNSRSRVAVRYSEQERAVELLEGQALFQVAKDRARPFIVTSDETRVRAVGTRFDVYRKRSGTVVTVVEGRVAVLAHSELPVAGVITVDHSLRSPPSRADGSVSAAVPSFPGILLSAGEQVTVTPTSLHKAVDPNVAGATAWRQRRLVFESASLAEVAEEFNRYNERQLIIQGDDVLDFHISGVFSSTDPASLLRFLDNRPGLQVIETSSEIRIAAKKVTDQ